MLITYFIKEVDYGSRRKSCCTATWKGAAETAGPLLLRWPRSCGPLATGRRPGALAPRRSPPRSPRLAPAHRAPRSLLRSRLLCLPPPPFDAIGGGTACPSSSPPRSGTAGCILEETGCVAGVPSRTGISPRGLLYRAHETPSSWGGPQVAAGTQGPAPARGGLQGGDRQREAGCSRGAVPQPEPRLGKVAPVKMPHGWSPKLASLRPEQQPPQKTGQVTRGGGLFRPLRKGPSETPGNRGRCISARCAHLVLALPGEDAEAPVPLGR